MKNVISSIFRSKKNHQLILCLCFTSILILGLHTQVNAQYECGIIQKDNSIYHSSDPDSLVNDRFGNMLLLMK